MPNWGEHLLVANKLANKIDVDKNLFLFGNILPDVQDGFLVKGISYISTHKINHYDDLGEKWGYQNFFKLYNDKLDNPIVLGYLSHLMTDYSWNNMFYDEKCVKENDEIVGYKNKNGEFIRKTKKEARIDKQIDFYNFQNYIYQNYDIIIPQYNDNISENARTIESVKINNEDVNKTIEYIKDTKENSQNKDTEMQIFTLEELEKQIDKTVNFIYDFIKKNNI